MTGYNQPPTETQVRQLLDQFKCADEGPIEGAFVGPTRWQDWVLEIDDDVLVWASIAYTVNTVRKVSVWLPESTPSAPCLTAVTSPEALSCALSFARHLGEKFTNPARPEPPTTERRIKP